MGDVKTRCICGSGRELPVRMDVEGCFQHDPDRWGLYDSVKDLDLRTRVLWKRYWRAGYLATPEDEVDFYIQAVLEEVEHEEDDR